VRIATFNVNGINGRLPSLLAWLKEAAPDIVCLQELKAPDEKFPEGAIRAAGYGAIWHGPEKLERRSDPGAGRTADGNPPRLARRPLKGNTLPCFVIEAVEAVGAPRQDRRQPGRRTLVSI